MQVAHQMTLKEFKQESRKVFGLDSHYEVIKIHNVSQNNKPIMCDDDLQEHVNSGDIINVRIIDSHDVMKCCAGFILSIIGIVIVYYIFFRKAESSLQPTAQSVQTNNVVPVQQNVCMQYRKELDICKADLSLCFKNTAISLSDIASKKESLLPTEKEKKVECEITELESTLLTAAKSMLNEDESSRIGKHIADMIRKVDADKRDAASIELSSVLLRYMKQNSPKKELN